MYAIVLVPVMFAAIIIGALLGGGARSTTACEAGYSVGGVSPLASRPSCPVSDRPKAGSTQDDIHHRAPGLHGHGVALPIHHHDPQ